MELAEITSEDPHAGLPDREELGKIDGDLRPVFAATWSAWRQP